MKKNFWRVVLAMVVVLVTLSHISWVALDNGWLMDVDGQKIDVLGIQKNIWNSWTRDCSEVTRLTMDHVSYQNTVDLIAAYSPPDSAALRIASVWSSGEWLLAEAEFKNLLPAVVIIQMHQGQARIVPQAVWSGYTQPWKAAPRIRLYLARQAPELPANLLSCFDPQSPSFQ
jgi:hypothetical protein